MTLKSIVLLFAVMSLATAKVPFAFGGGLSAQSQVEWRAGEPRSGLPGRTVEFDFGGYFSGTWSFAWKTLESPLGPEHSVTGVVHVQPVGESRFVAEATASGPSGPFRVREFISYRSDGNIVRQVSDGRGFSYLQKGTVSRDADGRYGIGYESMPFKLNGRTVVLRHRVRITSPTTYRVLSTVAVDGAPFVPYDDFLFERIGDSAGDDAPPDVSERPAGLWRDWAPRQPGGDRAPL